MVLRAEQMTREQLAACRLMARALSGEHGRTFRMMDMQDIVWDGDSRPEYSYSRVLFKIGVQVYGVCCKLLRGDMTTEFESYGEAEQ